MDKNYIGKIDELNVYLHTIVHELRNPLVSLQGYVKLLSEKLKESLSADDAGYWQRIESNLARLNDLLMDVSRLAKVTVNQADFNWVSAQQLIAAALESFDLSSQTPGVTLVIQPGMPNIYCDPNAMIQVFTNLISNAIKYLHASRASRIELGYVDGELFHKFFVKDNGVGMRLKDRDKVFQPFCRLEGKKNVSGSGLGLTIVKRIIEGHGGEIWLDPRLNQGVTVYFTLPKQLN